MAHRLKINIADHRKPAGVWDPDRRLAEALRDRAVFLAKYPQYRQFQDEIDLMLDKAGTAENRMAVLALLMEAKLMELQGQLHRLNRIFRSVSA